MLRKLAVLLASLAMILVSSLPLVLIPATQAAADWDMYHGGRTTGSSPPGSGDPGRIYIYDPPPDYIRVETGDCDVGRDGGWCVYPGRFTCSALDDGTLPTSWGAWVRKTTGMAESRWCNYPPKPTETDVYCPLSVSIEGFGPIKASRPAALTSRLPVVFPLKKTLSAWNQNDTTRKDASLCPGSVHLNAGFNYPKLGKYRMDVIESKQACKKVNYVGAQASVIKECGLISADTNPYYGQQWCGGTEDDWSDHGHDFTMEECTRVITAQVQCNKPKVKLDNLAFGAPNAVLDDGKRHTAFWQGTILHGTATEGSESTQTPVDTKVVVNRANTDLTNPSTPWRDGVVQEDHSQKFKGVPGVGGLAGDITKMEDLHWYAPGMPGSPWVLNRTVTVTGKFLLTSTRITSVDLPSDSNRVVNHEPVDIYFVDTVECPSAPLQVTVKRARNYR